MSSDEGIFYEDECAGFLYSMQARRAMLRGRFSLAAGTERKASMQTTSEIYPCAT